ncbi:hypothetical protein HanRHA438_Chr13g0588661 [Helianthus annuus]|nr:hypothetical protein HanRHA438_Chr13g0588661 [Helianthus annuus]
MTSRNRGCDIGCDSQPPMLNTNSMTRNHACESGCDSRPRLLDLLRYGPNLVGRTHGLLYYC